MGNNENTWILTAQCPGRLGTVDVVTRFLAENRCYIADIQSYDDREINLFCIRVQFRPLNDEFNPAVFDETFFERAKAFDMTWTLTEPNHKTRVAIMVSKYDHCL